VTLRVAVAGLGWAGRTIWLPRLAAHPGITVTALADPDPAVRAAAARIAPGVPVMDEPLRLTPADADLVVVAVPNHAHAPVAAGLLRRGVAVFLEKPVCLSTDEADDLAEAERAGGSVLVAGSATRYRADVRQLRALVPSLGPVRHVGVSWVRASGVPGTPWFTERGRSGGGVLVDLGWHLLDLLPVLLGPVDVDQVVGTVGADFVRSADARAAWLGSRPGSLPAATVEDTARAFLTTRDGVSVGLHTGWASHAEYDRTVVEVHGAAGTAVLGCTFGFSPQRREPVLTVHRGGQVRVVPPATEPVGREYDHQVDRLAGLLADPATPGQAAAAARTTIGVIQRIYDSAARAAQEKEPVWTAI
jgi:oxidoreductase